MGSMHMSNNVLVFYAKAGQNRNLLKGTVASGQCLRAKDQGYALLIAIKQFQNYIECLLQQLRRHTLS